MISSQTSDPSAGRAARSTIAPSGGDVVADNDCDGSSSRKQNDDLSTNSSEFTPQLFPPSQVPIRQVSSYGADDGASTHVDSLMLQAYGEPLACGTVEPGSRDCWFNRWELIVHLRGKLYSLPGGATGRKYVDYLSKEVSYFSSGTCSSERLLVFSSLILQRDRTIRKGVDIRRVIERRLDMWDKENYDVLVQEAVRCDKLLKSHHRARRSESHFTSVFTRLMLLGKVKAAVGWLTDKGNGCVFSHNDYIVETNSNGNEVKVPVLDVLRRKHPEPVVPPSSVLIDCDHLPLLEGVEITGGTIQRVASVIQGSAGPGGCDASHWQDALLRYGAHSSALRESVASAARRLANRLVS